MYKLPEDFTGYNVDLLDFRDFKSLCYSLQNIEVFKIKKLIDYQYPNNYFEAVVHYNYSEISFMQNCFVLVACFCTKKDENITYLDFPELSSAIKLFNSNIEILPKLILETSVNHSNVTQLCGYEENNVKFWLPATIGQLLFSWYFD